MVIREISLEVPVDEKFNFHPKFSSTGTFKRVESPNTISKCKLSVLLHSIHDKHCEPYGITSILKVG